MKAKIGELFLVLGTGLFVGGAIGFMAGYLSQDQTVMFLVAPLASASNWQMVRHDSRNTGYTNETVPDELELLRRGYDPRGWLDRLDIQQIAFFTRVSRNGDSRAKNGDVN